MYIQGSTRTKRKRREMTNARFISLHLITFDTWHFFYTNFCFLSLIFNWVLQKYVFLDSLFASQSPPHLGIELATIRDIFRGESWNSSILLLLGLFIPSYTMHRHGFLLPTTSRPYFCDLARFLSSYNWRLPTDTETPLGWMVHPTYPREPELPAGGNGELPNFRNPTDDESLYLKK